jgi:Integrase zinc binding domain
MDHFNEYLKGKQFILYTDHKTLEKLGHLHSKTINRFQMALFEHNFIIQYKKGSDMPADYLSRLPTTVNNLVVAAFDPFQTGLGNLPKEDDFAKNISHFGQMKQWPAHLSKKEANAHAELLQKMFHDKDGLLWVRFTDYKYKRTALLLPKKYQKEALCEAHNSIFGRHYGTLKTYTKITSSYYWLSIYSDIKTHVQTCLTCQQRKRSPTKPTPLASLPIPEQPN